MILGAQQLAPEVAALRLSSSPRATTRAASSAMASRPPHVGILAAEWYSPATYVPQTLLETADGCEGKYTVGLGQNAMAFCDDREDVGSLMLNALANLLTNYSINPRDVGRLEVGTETLIDKAKSIKTTLIEHLFEGNSDVEGVTSINACYGGTAALLNSVAWVESSAWDGRYALVVMGDIAVYAPGPARPTGGAGAVAMLIGPNAPLALAGPRATHATEVYDFYKPRGDTEYATVDGKLSQAAYLTAVDQCWAGLKTKMKAGLAMTAPEANVTLDSFNFVCMHSPYNKLVQKGFARLVYGDFCDAPDDDKFAGDAQRWKGVPPKDTVSDREAEKCFAALSKAQFGAKCSPSDGISREVGNCYTAAVYMNLLALVSTTGSKLEGKRVLLFSYGSGAVATALCLVGRDPNGANALGDGANADDAATFTIERIADTLSVKERLDSRAAADVAALSKALEMREVRYGACDYEPSGSVDGLAPGAFYLSRVDELYRRSYARKPAA